MMGVKDYIQITTTVCNLIYHLYPLATSIYDGFECFKRAATKEEIEQCLRDFMQQVQTTVHVKNFEIGETETKIICYVVRYIKAKSYRHNVLRLE